MIPLYSLDKNELKPLDPDSPFPEIDQDFGVDPFTEIHANQVAMMEGMKSIHRELFWIRSGVLFLVAVYVLNSFF